MKVLNKIIFESKKNSPAILMVAGGVAVVGSVVLACKATPKAVDIIEDMKATRATIEECKDAVEQEGYEGESYSEADYKRDIAMNYLQTSVKLAKAFAPTAAAVVVSLGCMYSSHYILNKRFVAISSAYSLLDTSFKKYRGNVIEKFGKDVDNELRGIKAVTITEDIVDENGKKKKVKRTVRDNNNSNTYGYSVLFSAASREFSKDRDANEFFLSQTQKIWTDRIKARRNKRGTLYEVLLDLDLFEDVENTNPQLAEASHTLVWDFNSPLSDGYVDFGCFDDEGHLIGGVPGEPNVYLNFNVDGAMEYKTSLFKRNK